MVETRELIESLIAEAKPVHRLWHPCVRALLWFAMAIGIVALLGVNHGLRPDFAEQLEKPSFGLSLAASLLTGVLAAGGSLIASLPDRSRAWLLLPLPALAVWVSTIGYGCLTGWVDFSSGTLRMGEAFRCFTTLVLVSMPLSLMMLVMLRHAARLRPGLVTLTAGLAVAAITSTAMALFHQLDATIMILAWNLGTAIVIVAIEATLGTRVLSWFQRASIP